MGDEQEISRDLLRRSSDGMEKTQQRQALGFGLWKGEEGLLSPPLVEKGPPPPDFLESKAVPLSRVDFLQSLQYMEWAAQEGRCLSCPLQGAAKDGGDWQVVQLAPGNCCLKPAEDRERELPSSEADGCSFGESRFGMPKKTESSHDIPPWFVVIRKPLELPPVVLLFPGKWDVSINRP